MKTNHRSLGAWGGIFLIESSPPRPQNKKEEKK